jgi:16S rRNA (cytosine967-C5)-methyltransferase
VCSTEPEEGEEAVNEFLKTVKEFRIIDVNTASLKQLINNGKMKTYPHKHNMDGFFGVSICRKKPAV